MHLCASVKHCFEDFFLDMMKRSILRRVDFFKSFNNIGKIATLTSNQEASVNKKITDFSIRKILSEELPLVHVSSTPLFSSAINPIQCPTQNIVEVNDIQKNKQCSLLNPINYVSENIAQNFEFAKCLECKKIYKSTEINVHIRTHNVHKYKCIECGKGFSQLRNYKYHVSIHRGSKEFATNCPECNKIFNDKGYLSSHLKIHRNLKEYGCPHCSKSFNQRVAFNMHVRIHTGVKPHKCNECNKRFSRKMLLKQHLRTHSGEKPYQCAVCGKFFSDRSNMILHHRLHSGVKPFSCPICPKAFTKKHHLKTHLNYHCGHKPYICPHQNCEQSFTQSSNMRTHSKKCQFRPIVA